MPVAQKKHAALLLFSSKTLSFFRVLWEFFRHATMPKNGNKTSKMERLFFLYAYRSNGKKQLIKVAFKLMSLKRQLLKVIKYTSIIL